MLYKIDKEYEGKEFFKTTDMEHPGVKMVMNQAGKNLAGASEGLKPGAFPK